MKILVYCSLAVLLCVSCKNKKKEEKDTSKYIPILSYLQSQVKKIDSSLYSIVKIETINGRSDTTPLHREQVRELAKDFLTIPNLTNPKEGSDYEQNSLHDTTMEMTMFSYLATNEDVEVWRQDATVMNGSNDIKNIYIEKNESSGNTVIEKKMIWEVDRYFAIKTITQKKNEPEKIHDLKVMWQDFQKN